MLSQDMSIDQLATTTLIVTVAVIIASIGIGLIFRRVMRKGERDASARKKSDGE